MEKDETVSDCSPHIANIGRLVEVSGSRFTLPQCSTGQPAPHCLPLLQLFLPCLQFSEFSSDLDASGAGLQAHPPQRLCSAMFPLITVCEQRSELRVQTDPWNTRGLGAASLEAAAVSPVTTSCVEVGVLFGLEMCSLVSQNSSQRWWPGSALVMWFRPAPSSGQSWPSAPRCWLPPCLRIRKTQNTNYRWGSGSLALALSTREQPHSSTLWPRPELHAGRSQVGVGLGSCCWLH